MIYVAESNRGLMIYNADNPDSIWYEGRYNPHHYIRDFELRGDLVYICVSHHFRVADISDPANAIQVAEYDIRADYLAMKDDFAYLGGGYVNEVEYENVHILDIGDLDEIEEIGLIEMERAKQIEVEGDFLFVRDIENQLHIFNISQPAEPRRVSVWSIDSPIGRFYVQTPTIFIAAGVNGMRVVDYSQPDRPVETGFYSSDDPVHDVCALGNVVYAVDGRTLKAFDVSQALGISNESAHKPFKFRLYAPYPNPFNDTATIPFSLPDRASVSLRTYDLNGRLVQDLSLLGSLNSGRHEIVWNARTLSTGIYFVRLESGGRSAVRRTFLLK